MPLRLVAAAAAVSLVAAVVAGGAAASELIDRNAAGVTLKVNGKGEALLSYTSGGKKKNVLAWGALNAIAPTQAKAQVKFQLDYSGGYGKYKQEYWKTFKTACTRYDGPRLQWLVAACKAPDGSYWALQSWQRALPNYGVKPTADQSVWELRLSHWKGELPVLDVKTNWAYKKFDHIYGRFTYLGQPVHGFRSTPAGLPLDSFGRNLYVDTFNSAYGAGWKRENSFLMHKGTGAFCYGFFSHGAHPVGAGTKYRATIIGPGVTPDIYWEGAEPGSYDQALDQAANAEIAGLGTRLCKPN